MHFNLDLKNRRCRWRKNGSGTFFLNKSDLSPALFVVLGNGTLLSTAFMDGRGYGWKSASERPIRSAFNGPEGKVRRITPFFPPLNKMFWNFPSGISQKADFFFYFIYCGFLLYMNCFCWTLCSKHSLSAPLDLCDTSSQMQMMGPNITRTGGNSREGESCILGEEIGARKAVFQFFTQRVFSVFSLLFSKNSRFVALRTLQRMSLIFQRSLPTPLSSQKMPSWTFNKIQLDSSIHLPS